MALHALFLVNARVGCTGIGPSETSSDVRSCAAVRVIFVRKCRSVPPGELEKVVRVASVNLEDGTIVEITSGTEPAQLSTLTRNGPLPDIIRTEFSCMACGEVFLLRCEAYHGRGGSWSLPSVKNV